MGRLFTIGDSISQGFRSGCTAFTETSYSKFLADALGVKRPDHRYLQWPDLKLKFDLEAIFRLIQKRFGSDVSGLEWLGLFPLVAGFLDKSEDYYERGEGRVGNPIPGYSHDFTDNCAVEGMRVADAWEVTPELCLKKISADPAGVKNNRGLAVAGQPFYRAAYRVLNPQGEKKYSKYKKYSAIHWLRHVASTEGVENTIVFLGANNALGTIFDLKVKMTRGTSDGCGSRLGDEEKKYNLWHPRDFHRDYAELLEQLGDALSENKFQDWKVYVGTIPLVTIAPMLQGFGEERLVYDPRLPLGQTTKQFRYYQYYTYFGVREETAIRDERRRMKFRDALFIDKTIIEFNKSIQSLVAAKNAELGREAFIVVDICNALADMAWKRNSGMPSYLYPEELQWEYPPLNTKFYRIDAAGELADGGVFSLDGIHPTVIGQGLIAWEFLKAFKQHGSSDPNAAINWQMILEQDDLRNKPISVIHDLVEKDEMIDFLVQAVSLLGR